MGSPNPDPIDIDPVAMYIASGAYWLPLPPFEEAECGIRYGGVIWHAMTGAELSAAMAGFQQCIAGSELVFVNGATAQNIDAIFGPYP